MLYNVGTNGLQIRHTQQKRWTYNDIKIGMLISCDSFTCLLSYSILLVNSLYPIHIKLGTENCKRSTKCINDTTVYYII